MISMDYFLAGAGAAAATWGERAEADCKTNPPVYGAFLTTAAPSVLLQWPRQTDYYCSITESRIGSGMSETRGHPARRRSV